jgi:phosphoribosyl 1,2-cyclic phosphate phosphodiesterase
VKITFLGTGTSQGVPVIACECAVCRSADPRDQRLRCAVLIEQDGRNLVIDTGPDFRQQMLRVQAKRLDAVLFTHHHKDHLAGMDDIRAFNFRQGTPMDIYANSITIGALHKEFSYVFADEKYPGVPSVVVHEIEREPFEAAGFAITPIPVMHHRLPVLGFRIGRFAYVTDANHIAPSSMALLRGLDVLVLNALRREAHISHFTLEEAIEVVTELQPRQAYFTHMSHVLGLHADIDAELPAGVALAYDGLSFEVD